MNLIMRRLLSVLLVIALCSAFGSTPIPSFSKYAFEIYSDVTIGSSDTFSLTEIDNITGTPNVAETLNAGKLTPTNATATYQWQSCPVADGTYSDIIGATAETYTLAATDENCYIKVTATGFDKYKGDITSAAFGPIKPPLLTELTSIGDISGSALINQPLSAGAVLPSGASVTYRWLRASSENGSYTPIGAASGSYTSAAADIDCYLKVEATGSGSYTGTVTSAAFGPVTGIPLTGISNISGTTSIGSTLTAGTVTPLGATFTYQWQTIDGSGNIGNIGTNSSTFILTSAESNCFIRVQAIGTGNYLKSTLTSAATASKVGTTTMALSSMGAIVGTVQVGETLTAGVVAPAGANVTYQWWKCQTSGGAYTAIAGATNSTYTLQSSDYNYFIRVIATGSGSYSGSKTSTTTSAASAGVIKAIADSSGACAVGQTLTAGTLTPAGATVTYLWYKASTPYGTYSTTGITTSTLTLSSSDLNYYFEVKATGSGNYTGSATSAFIGPVFSGSPVQLTSIAAIGGSAHIGAVLTAGDLAPSGATATYQWQRCYSVNGTYSDISGATSESYTVNGDDNGYYLRIKAIGSGRYTGTVTSTPTGLVTAQSITGITDIVGTAVSGNILTAGTVTPFGATVTYQWQRIDSTGAVSDIPGATASAYTTSSADNGCYIRVTVTGTGAYTGTAVSEPTPNKIGAASSIALTSVGSIAGALKVGETLAAGALAPVGAIATYQWQKCTSSTGSFINIPGATDSSYKLTSEDYTYFIRVIATGASIYTGTQNKTTTAKIATQATITAIDSIAGTAATGQTLTAGTLSPAGATVSYQWTKASSAYGTYSSISGATFSTLILSATDVGSYFKVTATGTGGYTGSVTSAFVGPAFSGSPIQITAIAAIGGSAQIGEVLTAGDVSPSGAEVTYQWQRGVTADGTYSDISGATSGTYTVTADDSGCYIRVRAIGSGSYTGTVTSSSTALVAAQLLTAISDSVGTALTGNVLTAGTVTPLGATVTYQWQTNDGSGNVANIAGATSSALWVLSDFSNCYLQVKITGTGAYTGTVVSAPTPTRVTSAASTALGGTVSIMGKAMVSETLTAITTAITPIGATLTYQWQRCTILAGTYGNIVGATGRTYTLTGDDVGDYFKVVVTGSGSYSSSKTSAATAVIAVKPITAVGSIIGTTAVGQTLAAGAVTPSGASVTYQWQSCATSGGTYASINGATQSTYVLGTGDVGRYIKVLVNGTGGYSSSVTSAYAGPVFSGSATALTSIGTVSGTAQVGQTLTAGAATPVGATVAYQWQRGLSSDGTYSNISGAASATYKLTADDFGCFIRVRAIGSGTYTGTVTSLPTNGTVAACPLSAISNVIGTTYIGRPLTAGTVTPLGATVTYQWQSSSDGSSYTNIAGATADTYVIQSQDSYCFLRVVATGTGAYTGSAASASTPARAFSSPVPTAVTAIGAISSTSAKVGVTQTAGALTPSGATVTYQWTRSTSITASTFVNIPGATGNTYVPVTDDVGYYLRVVATGSGAYSANATSNYKGLVIS